MEITKLNIGILIFVFIFYIITHLFIGIFKKKFSEIQNPTLEQLNYLKICTFLFKWFSCIYVIIIIIVLYLIGS